MAKVNPNRPAPPKGTRLAGEALWSAVLDRYELEHHELLLLREIVRCVDDLDRLANLSARQGAITANGGIDPAIAEARQMRITLATLIGALRLPAEDEQAGDEPSLRRPQRRAAVRSVDPYPAPMEPPAPLDRGAVARINVEPIRTSESQPVLRAVTPQMPAPQMPAPQILQPRRRIPAGSPANSSQISVTELLERLSDGCVPADDGGSVPADESVGR
ncbi:MAG: hypothetical protein K0U70_05085 [Actinomycetia bacterium]|nr:hypothetical protein [Actinomycetes bacterium]MCH9710549.1 hypothetical protein [Actinomycetes bacterium]MCH9767155.1 hypothetical protein [Actinomycetes bacterium]